MVAALKDIVISQGYDFSYSYTIQNQDGTDYDLTGYTGVAKIRPEPNSPIILATFSVSISTVNGGPVTISLTAVTTTSLALGVFHWDHFLTHASAPDLALLKGRAVVEAAVSRA